jgi:hypothetical protein
MRPMYGTLIIWLALECGETTISIWKTTGTELFTVAVRINSELCAE